jgi:uncharacterized coiled-coil protein SlyX
VIAATSQALQSQLLTSSNQVAQLQATLRSSQESLSQLQPKLQDALAKNSELQTTLSAKQIELDKLKTQLTEAQTQLDKYKKLVTLFDKLDGVKFDKLVLDGLTAASTGFVTVFAMTPLVSVGLEIARALFNNFERDVATFRASVDWLRAQVDSLSGNIGIVEAAIGQAVKLTDPVTSRMTQLIDYILSNLPFGIGQSLRNTLKAINDLYTFLPTLATGATAQVISVLFDPFSLGDKGLAQTLLKPIREKMLDPAEKFTLQFKTLNEIYLRDLHIPTQQLINDRVKIHGEIGEYRKVNSI